MGGFSRQSIDDVELWVGCPDCQSAHESILRRLRKFTQAFLGTRSEVTNSHRGNLGEFIAFCLGESDDFSSHTPFPANAFNPLSSISRPEIDIVWVFFGQNDRDDCSVLQEVKTTSDPDIKIAYELVVDFDKLFGTDVGLTLHTRLQAMKNELQYKLNKPELCRRLSKLAGNSPKTSANVRLLPTIVYERENSKPEIRMHAVRTILIGRGWPPQAVESWAIGLFELDPRLIRLAMGKP
jgi:hypothetical protein